MKVYRKKLMIVLLLVSLLSACKKKTEQIKEVENTISYNFSEKIKGGTLGSAKGDSFSFGGNDIKIVYNERVFGQSKTKENGVLALNLFYYDLSDIKLRDAVYKINNYSGKDEVIFILDSSETNSLEITYVKREYKILSGTFDLNFVLVDSVSEDGSVSLNGEETVQITNGQFDLIDIDL